MPLNSLHFLPVSVFILLPATFIISYVISILLNHVEVEFPYISDTGTYIPESCIFGQLLNIVAVLIAITMYVRYKQVEQYYRDHLSPESGRILRMNVIALYLGWIASFGVSIVANFQETSVFPVHMVGAFLAFGMGTVYSWVQTVMSFRMHPLVNSKRVAYIRLAISIIVTFAFITTGVAGPISVMQFHGKDKTKWNPEDGGFTMHIVSTAAEWVLALSFNFYILSFTPEMQRISLTSPKVQFITEVGLSHSHDLYHNQDHVEISQSQNSRSTGSPRITSPLVSSEVPPGISTVTTEAIIH